MSTQIGVLLSVLAGKIDDVDMERIRELARAAHAGQPDAAGRDYHDAHLVPIAAGCAVFGPDAEAAGWLHDIVEDTDITAADLRGMGIDDVIVAAVESVSKTKGEPYAYLIERACAHPLGRLVKLVDNAWNVASNPVLARTDPDRAAAMLRDKYLPARERLLEAAGLTSDSDQMVEVDRILQDHLAQLEG